MREKLQNPIILIGNVRSGTTMLQKLFDLHPDICTWFEPRTVWNYAAPWRTYDRLDERDASPRVIRYIRKRFLEYQERNGGRRIMEKTPNNVVRIPYVHKIFPESKFLYIVRNPLSQLSSSELKWKPVIDWQDRRWAWYRIKNTPKTQLLFYVGKFLRELYDKKILGKEHAHLFGVLYKGIQKDRKKLTTEEIIAKQWVYSSRQADKDFAKFDECIILRIRYEDFVNSPVDGFASILHQVGYRMTKKIAEEIPKFVDPNRQHKWQRLNSKILRRCLPILRNEMIRHGYNIPSEIA